MNEPWIVPYTASGRARCRSASATSRRSTVTLSGYATQLRSDAWKNARPATSETYLVAATGTGSDAGTAADAVSTALVPVASAAIAIATAQHSRRAREKLIAGDPIPRWRRLASGRSDQHRHGRGGTGVERPRRG